MNKSQGLQFTMGKLLNFDFDVLKPNTTNSTDPTVPIIITEANTPTRLSKITVNIADNSNVWLYATAAFNVRGADLPVSVIFKIWRGHPSKGDLVFSTADAGQGNEEVGTFRNSSFTSIDMTCNTSCSRITYYLTAESTKDTQMIFIGPITFIGANL